MGGWGYFLSIVLTSATLFCDVKTKQETKINQKAFLTTYGMDDLQTSAIKISTGSVNESSPLMAQQQKKKKINLTLVISYCKLKKQKMRGK